MTVPKVIPVSAPPDILYWSLLDHYVEKNPAAVGSAHPEVPLTLDVDNPQKLDPSLLNPGFLTNGGVTRDPTLQACVNKFITDKITNLEAWVGTASTDETKTAAGRTKMLEVVRSLGQIRFAVVDLTANLNAPKFAGNDAKLPGAKFDLATETDFGGSMVKIAVMYAAYQLQYDLNVLAKKLNMSLAAGDDHAKKKAELFQVAWDSWVQTQKDDAAAPAKDLPSVDPKLKLQLRLVKRAKGTKIPMTFSSWNDVTTWGKKHKNPIDGAPNLENIFDVVEGSPMRVTFKNDKTNYPPDHKLDEAAKRRLGEFAYPTGRTFYDRLFSTIDASNNAAAGSCILDVGYLYIASALMQAGLYSPERGGGLWLTAPYPDVRNAVKWIENPIPMHEQIIRGVVNDTRHYQDCSAVAGAAFMTLLAQNRLVSPMASDQMKFLMNKKKPGAAADWHGTDTYSPVKSALEKAGFAIKTAISKLGLSPQGDISDCAYIEREVEVTPAPHRTTKLLRFVICMVDLPPSTQSRMLTILVEGLDQCIRDTNHVP